MPEMEPSEKLKSAIMERIEAGRLEREVWLLKPVLVLASFLIVALLGTALSLSLFKEVKREPTGSPILRWAESRPDAEFLKGSL